MMLIKKTSTLVAVLSTLAICFAGLHFSNDAHSATISTKYLEWDNQKYLDLRSEATETYKKKLELQGNLVNVPSDMPALMDTGGYYVIVFAGVSLAEFSSFAEVRDKTGYCSESGDVSSDFASVICVFKP